MHIPVMLTETVDSLDVKSGGVYVDGTLGSAGHASEIMRRAGAEGRLLGIDRDEAALARSRERLAALPGTKVLVHGRHGDLTALAAANGFDAVDGVLLDLGVSSNQLDEAERGFSFRMDGPLDMRMDPTSGESAADLVATRGLDELTEILRTFGEEPNARRIAKAICAARERQTISTTADLAAVVEKTVGRHGPHHPATRTFQAFRMAVNEEVQDLGRALEGGLGLLKPGGRFAVITFESLTDRIVKRFFAAHAGKMISLQQGGERWEGDLPKVRPVTRRPVCPGPAELSANPRARSAKLRTAERI